MPSSEAAYFGGIELWATGRAEDLERHRRAMEAVGHRLVYIGGPVPVGGGRYRQYLRAHVRQSLVVVPDSPNGERPDSLV
jgi:hypothetical protein